MKPNTTNRFLVAAQGDEIRILCPVPQRLTRDQALNLAAYLVALADPGREDFLPLLEAILDA